MDEKSAISRLNLLFSDASSEDYAFTEVFAETVQAGIKALEKQIPSKPKEYEDRYYACKCGNILMHKWRIYPTKLIPKSEGLPHCMACGQAIDWSDENDRE